MESFCFDELPYSPKPGDIGDFDFKEKAEIKLLRKHHPELALWGDVAIFMAWGEYSEFVLKRWNGNFSRTEEFLDYLCWQQMRGGWTAESPRELLEEMRTEWKPGK